MMLASGNVKITTQSSQEKMSGVTVNFGALQCK